MLQSSHGKRFAKREPWRLLRCAVHADQLEDIVVGALRKVDHLIREQADVDEPSSCPPELTTGMRANRRVANIRSRSAPSPSRGCDDVVDHHFAHQFVGGWAVKMPRVGTTPTSFCVRSTT